MNLFHLKTNEIQLFKCLIESLKEIMIETNLELCRDSIRICKVNSLNRIYCMVHLTAEELNKDDNFYKCEYPEDKPLIVGINLLHISKILRTIGTDNVLHLQVHESNKNILNIQVEMTHRLIISTYTINFIEVNVEHFDMNNIQPPEFDKTIKIESKYFQKQIKELNNLDSEFLEIIVCQNEMMIRGYGGYITKQTQIYMPENNHKNDEDEEEEENENENAKNNTNKNIKNNKTMKPNKNNNSKNSKTQYLRTIELISHNDKPFQGKYLTKDFLCISKFTNLSDIFTLKLKNDLPLLLTIQIPNFGEITLVIWLY